MTDDRLIVALDVPNALEALKLTDQIGDAVSFYKIGLGMLTGGGLALANELKQEHGKLLLILAADAHTHAPLLPYKASYR